MPKIKDPVEIEFAKKFTDKGGKFIFVEDKTAALETIDKILQENNWKRDELCCLNPNLGKTFQIPVEESIPQHAKALLLTCEYLVANKGGMLICQHQIQNLSMDKLPDSLVVYAGSDQFAPDVSEGMTLLKSKYFGNLPTNITTLNAKDTAKENDFLTQGSSSKNIYLILQE
ncbi:MAG: lactate utilization protein B/C [Flavobacteriaceae bacterium]